MEAIQSELLAFIEQHNKIKQREEGWYASMGRTVGGSEIAAIMGKSSYSNFYDIVARKIKIVKKEFKMQTNFACLWGTVFEDVAAEYIKYHFNFEPIGTEITIMNRPGFRYSPDGYIIGGIKKNGRICWPDENKALIDHYAPIMLEIKCPSSRDLGPSVPAMYLPQILAGLEFSIPNTVGMFVDCKFRKCALDELNESLHFDRHLHKKNHNGGFKAVAWGMIGLFTKDGETYDDYRDDNLEFRYMNEWNFTKILENINKWEIKFSEVKCNADEQIYEWSKVGKLHKVIPWKLLEIRFIQVDKQEGFLDSITDRVNAVNSLVDEATKQDDPVQWYINYLMEKNITIPEEIRSEVKRDEKEETEYYDSRLDSMMLMLKKKSA